MEARPTADHAAQLVSASAAILAGAVLADSALEHYRGSFRNPAMLLPLLASGVSAAFNSRAAATGARDNQTPVHGAAIAIGAIGLGFHVYNVAKRPGRIDVTNLFYGAPVGAPGALILSGVLGAMADRRRPTPGNGALPLDRGRALGAVVATGLAGTVAEAGFLHFRGAYHNAAMWLPVLLPPAAAISLGRDVATDRPRPLTAGLLGATALLGCAGAGFHVRGVARNMGGWRNWRQNILAGPPIPAPPAFTGLAIAGLAAWLLMRRRDG